MSVTSSKIITSSTASRGRSDDEMDDGIGDYRRDELIKDMVALAKTFPPL